MNVYLFDVDGTLVESSETILDKHALLLNDLKKVGKIGIVGGGKLDKILSQLNNRVTFDYYFTECGSIYHDSQLNLVSSKNIRTHHLYPIINILIKEALNFLSNVTYTVTGHFIDLRSGLVYISLIGMNATAEEREYFKELNKDESIRNDLINVLKNTLFYLCKENEISINIGGSVGIAIFPSEYDKVQVLEHFNSDDKIYYFGDKYTKIGNDYKLLTHPRVTGYNIDNIENTYDIIRTLL